VRLRRAPGRERVKFGARASHTSELLALQAQLAGKAARGTPSRKVSNEKEKEAAGRTMQQVRESTKFCQVSEALPGILRRRADRTLGIDV